jgi:hypothetical protein
MRPTNTTPAERQVIRWFFGPLLLVALVVILWMWATRVSECASMCAAKGYAESTLHLNEGGRFDIGTYCECSN